MTDTDHEWFLQREELLKKYSDKFHVTIQRCLDEKIHQANELKNREMEQYTQLSKKGKPFSERKATGEKIGVIDQIIKKAEARKKETFPPLQEFLKWGDYEKIEMLGFENFIKLYFL